MGSAIRQRNDVELGSPTPSQPNQAISSPSPRPDPLQNMSSPMTRSRAKKMKEALAQLIQATQAKEALKIHDFSPTAVSVLFVIMTGHEP